MSKINQSGYKKLLVVLCGVFWLHSSWALDVTLLGGLSLSSPTTSTLPTGASTAVPLTVKGSSQTAFGILLDKHISRMFALETGAIYSKDKFNATYQSSINNDFASNTLQVPLLLRFTGFRFISVGVGGYWGYGAGDITLTDHITSANSGVSSYSAESESKTDYGALFDARIRIPIGIRLGLVIDGRYLMGVKERETVTTGGATYKTKMMQVLAGLNFWM